MIQLDFLVVFSFLPMPEEFGIDLAPNTASSIAVQLNQVLGPEYSSPSVVVYFQIVRQPDPYVSHCVDSWADTGIQVPESTNYSLAVEHIWKYFSIDILCL